MDGHSAAFASPHLTLTRVSYAACDPSFRRMGQQDPIVLNEKVACATSIDGEQLCVFSSLIIKRLFSNGLWIMNISYFLVAQDDSVSIT